MNLGSLESYLYDKYDRSEPVELTPNYIGVNKASRAGDVYYPMMEVGKRWEYLLKDINFFPELEKEDQWATIFVDKKEIIDGKEYYAIMWQLKDCEPQYFGHIREDIEKKQVWGLFPYYLLDDSFRVRDGEDVLLYDFINPHDSFTINFMCGSSLYTDEFNESIYVSADGKERASFGEDQENLFVQIVEGLGVIPKDNAPKGHDRYIIDSTIYGPEFMIPCSFPHTCVAKMLIRVVGADGEVQYFDPEVEKVASLPQPGRVKSDWTITPSQVTIRSGSAIGRIQIVDARGVVVRSFDIAESEFTINTEGYTAGTYIVSACGKTQKITVK